MDNLIERQSINKYMLTSDIQTILDNCTSKNLYNTIKGIIDKNNNNNFILRTAGENINKDDCVEIDIYGAAFKSTKFVAGIATQTVATGGILKIQIAGDYIFDTDIFTGLNRISEPLFWRNGIFAFTPLTLESTDILQKLGRIDDVRKLFIDIDEIMTVE